MAMPRPRLAPALAPALALALAGCSGSSTPAPTAAASPDAGRTVAVGQNGMPRFVTPGAAAGEEDQVTVGAGATVTWRFLTSGYNVISGGGPPGAGCVPELLDSRVHGNRHRITHLDGVQSVIIAEVADFGDGVQVVDTAVCAICPDGFIFEA